MNIYGKSLKFSQKTSRNNKVKIIELLNESHAIAKDVIAISVSIAESQ